MSGQGLVTSRDAAGRTIAQFVAICPEHGGSLCVLAESLVCLRLDMADYTERAA